MTFVLSSSIPPPHFSSVTERCSPCVTSALRQLSMPSQLDSPMTARYLSKPPLFSRTVSSQLTERFRTGMKLPSSSANSCQRTRCLRCSRF